MFNKFKSIISIILIYSSNTIAQNYIFNSNDSIKGDVKNRINNDVIHYNINIDLQSESHTVKGFNEITFLIKLPTDSILLDLNSEFIIDSIISDQGKINFNRIKNYFWIKPKRKLIEKEVWKSTIYYKGKLPIAKNPPWDGGFTFSKDKKNNDWIAVSCQSEGLQHWLPCKDHSFDEPDSINMKIIHDYKGLKAVSNGKCKYREVENEKEISIWEVKNKINNYNITLNIADYISFFDTLKRNDNSVMPLQYYVLKYNEKIAKKHFEQTKKILAFLENTWGKYAFENDGFKMVETPYWGMEHQSCISYGNNFKNNEYGFDFIILHETAHEWWGNSISCNDNADMWIHESLATYSEALFVEKTLGTQKMLSYLLLQKQKISNTFPQKGFENVNFYNYPNSDMYYKGTWMWHTLRNIINNDVLWENTLREMYTTFAKTEISSKDVIRFLNKKWKMDLNDFFEIYLQKQSIPQYCINNKIKSKNSCTILDKAITNDIKKHKLASKEILNKYLILIKTN